MANRKITQFTDAAGTQTSTWVMPIVNPALGAVDAANLKTSLNDLFKDLGQNTSDGATGMTGLLAAPSASAAGKLKWYYNNSTKQWLASIDAGSYYSVQRSIAAGLTAGWLPYVDTGGILNGSGNATLDSNGQIGCKFLNLTSNAAGLNSVAEINDSTGTDRWEIRLGASNQLIIQDFQNNKDVITLTPGATPVVQLNGTLRWLTDNSQDIGLINSGRARTAYIGTSVIIGRSSNTTGVLTFNNSTNTNQTSFQAGAAAASRTYTWPTDFGAAGSVLTDAAGNGTLSWTAAAGITGSIAATQVAYGSGANTITGTSGFTFTSTGLTIQQAAYQRFYIYSTGSSSDFTVQSDTANANAFLQGRYSYLYFYSGTAGVVTQKWQQYMLDADNALRFYNLINSQTHMTLNPSTSPDNSSTSFNSRIVIGTTSSVGSGGQVDVTLTSASRIGQIIKLAAAQSASASQVQNSSGTVLQDTNSGGMLTIGTASTSLDRAIYIKSPGFDSSAATYGLLSAYTVPTTSTTSSTGNYSQLSVGSAAYTVTNVYCFFAASPNISGSGAITNNYGLQVNNQGAAAVTNAGGICINAQSGATNNTHLLIGTTTIPSGNFAIYQNSTSPSYFNGSNTTGYIGIGSNPAANTVVSCSVNVTDPGAATTGLVFSRNVILTGNNGQTIVGIDSKVNYSSGAFNPTGINVGVLGSAWLGTAGTATRLTGIQGYVYNTSTGTVTAAFGVKSALQNLNASGNVTAFYSFFANDSTDYGFNSGTVANWYGFYAANPPAGTLTNNYGIYIENQTRGGSLNYAIYSAGGLCYFAGPVRINQNSSTSGVITVGGASNSGAYLSVSTSSQVANDKLISVSMAGSITGTLYAADISMTATVNVLTRITNTENATATSNCELQLVTGGASGGDPFIHFNISGNTDWSIGADNSDSDKLVIAASTALGTSNALTITTAGLVTFTGSIVITGKQKNLTVSTGAGSAALGANCPAATPTAPFEWVNVTLSDGSTGYIPAWK